jgi:hypothetical protein
VVSGKVERGSDRRRWGHTNWVKFARNGAEKGGKRANSAATLLPYSEKVRHRTEKSDEGQGDNVSSSRVLVFVVPVWAGV